MAGLQATCGAPPSQVMADGRGSEVYDEDLYGAQVTGYAAVVADIEEDEDELDERERVVAK